MTTPSTFSLHTDVGSDLTETLSTVLQQAGCFEVMERASFDQINQETDM